MSNVKLPKPSLLDRAIGVVSPHAMNARLRAKVSTARYVAMANAGSGGYDANDPRRVAMRNARRLAGSGDAAINPQLDALRDYSSNLVRNQPLATGALDTIATDVIGGGLQLQARPERKFLGLSDDQAQKYEADFERFWAHLSSRIDYNRRYHRADLEWLMVHLELEHGDVFSVNTAARYPGDLFDLKIQIVEAPLVCNPERLADSTKIAQGIEYDPEMRPVAIHAANRHPNDYLLGSTALTWTRVPIFGATTGRRNVIQLMAPLRANQSRGVPVLATVIETLQQLGDWTASELQAAVVQSCFAIKTKTEGGNSFPESDDDAAATGDGRRSGIGTVDLTMKTGLVIDGLGVNEDIEGFAPTRPNPDFDPFFIAMVRQLAVALGLSASLLLRHFTASYSASRGEMLQVWKIVMRRRARFTRMFNQELYVLMLGEAHEKGYVNLRGWNDPLMRDAWCRARWIGPSQGQLNPKDEVAAAALMIENDLSTAEEQTATLNGGDYDSNMEQRTREVRARRAAGTGPQLPPRADAPAPRPNPDALEDETAEPS